MCGIIGYVGKNQAAPILIKGLKRLEYRGYDSSGVACCHDGRITCVKALGKIAALSEKMERFGDVSGTIGIGHTRWATHGAPSDTNSHPHLSCDGNFAIVHNGIIENYAELKNMLCQKGIAFSSETDSEVIAQLLMHLYDGNMLSTVGKVTERLIGSYAVGIISVYEPNTIYAVRKNNPLVIGLGKGENFIASDFAAALEYTHDFIQLDEGQIARITDSAVTVFNGEVPVSPATYKVDWDISQAEKNGYPHFMLKEIYEQPRALQATRSRQRDCA